MSDERRLSRGSFLLLGAGAALPFVAGPLAGAFSTSAAPGRIASLFTDLDAARAIGREYLRAVPGERDAAALVRLIGDRVEGGSAVLAHANDATARALLAARTLADFDEDALAVVDGWVLAVTEARLCALAALLA